MKKNKSTIILATAILGAVSVAVAHNTMAITYQDTTNVEFTFNPTINVSLSSSDLTISNLAPGSTSDSNVITATVSTNAGYGYYLSATTGTAGGNTNLTNTADSTYNFASLSSNAATLFAIPDNKWGYSYSTDNGTTWISGDNGSALAGYNGLPLDADDSGATGVKLLSSDSFATSGSVKFKIGARASSDQASGTYTGTVNFYAVTNPEPAPYMQDLTSTKLNQLLPNVGDTTTAVDKRDEQAYAIAKLADNKYWMVENLNIAGNTLLTSELTDFPSTYTLPTDQGWQSDGKLPVSSMTGFSNNNYAYVYNSNNKEDCGASGQAVPCYSYYSWDVATLGSGRSMNVRNTDAPYSICPKGWKLPTSRSTVAGNSDLYQLATAYGMTTSDTSQYTANFYNQAGPGTIPNFLVAGLYESNRYLAVGTSGYSWSSTVSNDTDVAYYLSFSTDYIGSADWGPRYYGLSIRCLFSDQ